MRKLKLQMQITVDGFVAGPNGELDWMASDMEDDKLYQYVNFLTDSSDTILMGRKMTDEFVNYWTNVLKNPKSPEYAFAKKRSTRRRLFLQRLSMNRAGQTPFLQKATLLRKSTSSKTGRGRI
ncbi:MAG TPA: dihydrofolate reductase family protein [Pyrinomonadaceae bacterium]